MRQSLVDLSRLGLKRLWHRPLVMHRFFEVYGERDVREVGSCWHPDDGRVVTEWEGRMMDVQESKTFSVKDRYGNVEIWHVVGKYEQAVGVPVESRVLSEKSVTVYRRDVSSVRKHAWSRKVVQFKYVPMDVTFAELGRRLVFPVDLVAVEWVKDNEAARHVETFTVGGVIKGATRDLRIFWLELGVHHTAGWLSRGRMKLMMILLAVSIVGIVVVGAAGAYFSSQVHFQNVCYAIHGLNYSQILCPLPHVVTTTIGSSTSTVGGVTVYTVSLP